MSENVNCLENKQCPSCNNRDRLQVQGSLWLDICDEGSEPTEDKFRGEHDYDAKAQARCPECGFEAIWDTFDVDSKRFNTAKKRA